MDDQKKIHTRKGFIALAIASSAFLTLAGVFRGGRKKAVVNTAKLLTQDGKLVEVDVSRLPRNKKKISNREIHTWITNTSSLKTNSNQQ